ncbi:MAG: dihydroorotase [Methylophagaceae bacterium]|jgi:dihydroorotase
MRLTITQPDDWHLHLRDGAALCRTVTDTSRYFSRAIVMPNLAPPVTTTEQALAYRQRIFDSVPNGKEFQPLMTLYLTDNTTVDEIQKAHDSGYIQGIKLYPAGATTNSDAGVTDLKHCHAALAQMAHVGMPLLIHGEVTDHDIDIFDREKVFIDRILAPLMRTHPTLRIVLEHITTADAVEFVMNENANIAATITAHHLLLNRNDLLVGGVRPHHYCLPILKRRRHQEALLEAATSGNPCFFLGTDSAPHAQDAKESACGCAGIYSAHAALEFYAEAFEQADALDKLEGFASHFGPDFYHLPRNTKTVTLTKKSWDVPTSYECNQQTLIPLRAGHKITWTAALN